MVDRPDRARELASRLRAAAERWPDPNPQEVAHLTRAFSKLTPDQQVEILLEPFGSDPSLDSNRSAQEYAGRILFALAPQCPRPLEQVIRAVLPTYELSVEQLPWYLESVFGRAQMLAALDFVSQGDLTDRELRSADTFRFWLRARPPHD